MELKKIAIIGLGYVGLPLSVAFGQKYITIGFDINKNRIKELNNGIDITLEVSEKELVNALKNKFFSVTSDFNKIKDCNVYIITVPTPVDINKKPDLKPLIIASELVSSILKKEDIVIYESTVYPGATEEVCIPILEKNSKMVINKDFYVGYSPERINPGDKEHTVTKILKVTSGSNLNSSLEIDELYRSVITAGTFRASSIKVAEAAKVIENSQRDINIAFVNELSKIFNLMNIDTNEVLEAAATKWNFLKFKPGLVGGHCIGVDPYKKKKKSQELGYNPEIILAGRRLNDSMGKYVANETIKLMVNKAIEIKSSEVLLLGFTFKENCPDFRNTRVIDIVKELNTYDLKLTIVDPHVNINNVVQEYGINILNNIPKNKLYDSVILAVSHDYFIKLNLNNLLKTNNVVYDVKGVLEKSKVDKRL